MVATPVWQAATAGQPGVAGHVNQFLGTHQASFLYGGAITTQQVTGTGAYTGSQGTWMSQVFTTAANQTAIGSVNLQISTVGGSPTLALIPPITVSIYAAYGGVPVGPALVSTPVNDSYVYSAGFWVNIPTPVTGLSGNTTYAIVTAPVGTITNYYAWQHSNQIAGASTSADGATWTTPSPGFGFMYQVLDQSVTSGLPTVIYEDSGARWTQYTYSPSGAIMQIVENTSGQTASTYLRSTRTVNYTNGLITGVA